MGLEALKKRREEIQIELRKLVESIEKRKGTEEVVADEKKADELLEERASVDDQIATLERRARIDQALPEIRGGAGTVIETGNGEKNVAEERAKKFASTGKMSMPLSVEGRSLLVTTGNLTKPTGVGTEIGQLPTVISSILDHVFTKDATGTGSWKFPYKKKDATATAHTEGQKYGGTGSDYDEIIINPSEWGVMDQVSDQVEKQTPLAYEADVRNSAYLALRKYAKEEITKAILNSELAEKRNNVVIDEKYVRDIMTNFGGEESVAGGTVLYLNKKDIAKLGDIRGKNELKAVFDINYTDANNGTIKDGGTTIKFCLNNSLPEGTQLYGQPQTVKFLTWGPYEVATDNGGEFFKTGMLGIRGRCTGGADLVVPGGMQIITQGE